MESGADKLRVLALLLEHVSDGRSMHGIERAVDLIQQVEWRWIASLDGEDERERNHALLSAAQLMRRAGHAGEGDLDSDSRVARSARELLCGLLRLLLLALVGRLPLLLVLLLLQFVTVLVMLLRLAVELQTITDKQIENPPAC